MPKGNPDPPKPPKRKKGGIDQLFTAKKMKRQSSPTRQQQPEIFTTDPETGEPWEDAEVSLVPIPFQQALPAEQYLDPKTTLSKTDIRRIAVVHLFVDVLKAPERDTWKPTKPGAKDGVAADIKRRLRISNDTNILPLLEEIKQSLESGDTSIQLLRGANS